MYLSTGMFEVGWLAVSPCGAFAAEGLVFEASVEDPYESVTQSA